MSGDATTITFGPSVVFTEVNTTARGEGPSHWFIALHDAAVGESSTALTDADREHLVDAAHTATVAPSGAALVLAVAEHAAETRLKAHGVSDAIARDWMRVIDRIQEFATEDATHDEVCDFDREVIRARERLGIDVFDDD